MRYIIAILILSVSTSILAKNCYQCDGINCLRTSYNKTQQCVDEMDICVTVYEGQTVQAQGCLQQLSMELRRKCDEAVESEHDPYNDENDDQKPPPSQCHRCLGDHCNNVVPDGFECIQCDSSKDAKCRSNPSAITPTKCPISRTNNMYCYVSDDGKVTMRGCIGVLKDQINCKKQKDCLLCSPFEMENCNVVGGGSSDNGNDGGGTSSSSSTSTTTSTVSPVSPTTPGGNGGGGNNSGSTHSSKFILYTLLTAILYFSTTGVSI